MKALIAARKRRDDAIAKADALNAIAESRAWEDTERAEYDAVMAQITQANADVARIEASQEFERTATPVASFQGDGTPISSTTNGVTRVHDNREDKPFASMGDFLQSVAGAASAPFTGGQVDPRLYAAASGASTGVPEDGGFLVRTDWSTALLEAAMTESVLAPMCRSINIGADSDGVELPYIKETSRANGSRFGGVQVYWKGEADTVTATKPELGEMEIRLQELMGIAYGTGRLLKDATALESIFTTAFTSEFGFKLDDAIVRGTGVGQPLGYVTATTVRVQQAKEVNQAADTVISENISNMWSRMPARSKARSVWLINSEINPQLDRLYIAAGTGGLEPRVVTYNDAGVMRIKGRPVVEIEQASALGDEGDISLVDMNEYLLIRKGGIEAAQSMHVRFLYDEQTFRWIYRINGRPAWHSALTPYKGSATQSPFVTLAGR